MGTIPPGQYKFLQANANHFITVTISAKKYSKQHTFTLSLTFTEFSARKITGFDAFAIYSTFIILETLFDPQSCSPAVQL